MLVVPDDQHYNNSAVGVVRQLAAVSEHENIHFGIVDASKQAGFLSNFKAVPLVTCLLYYPVKLHCVSDNVSPVMIVGFDYATSPW